MAAGEFISATGFAPLPDIGTLSYNGAQFSALFATSAHGEAIKDNAGRTTKYTELTILADGFVTLGEDDVDTIDQTMEGLQQALAQCGGNLEYTGKGLGTLSINKPGGSLWDVNWGPKPKLLEFQPLGASRAAKVKWQVTVCIPQFDMTKGTKQTPQPLGATFPLVQFNNEIGITYDDEGYAALSIRGTMEIPLTRNSITDRTLTVTVDNYRSQFLNQVATTIDLNYYRVTRRNFGISRDRRTMEWDFAAEELPPMPLPVGATSARGEFTVRPKTSGYGLANWTCSLNCTYTIRKDRPRRLAWAAFVSLLAFRMRCSVRGNIPAIINAANNAQQPVPAGPGVPAIPAAPLNQNQRDALLLYWQKQMENARKGGPEPALQNAFLSHFGFREGLYLDSKTVTFEASWTLITVIDLVMRASGLWQGTGVNGDEERQLWKTSMADIMGANSWAINRIDPKADIIIDLGIKA